MSYLINLILTLSLTLWACLSLKRNAPGLLFVAIFSVSTIFYGIGGIWYWSEIGDGTFLGVDWQPELRASQLDYLIVHGIVLFSFTLAMGRETVLRDTRYLTNSEIYSRVNGATRSDESAWAVKALGAITLISSLYVALVGAKLVASGGALTQDPFVLVMYQFSDVGIALLLFKLATAPKSRFWWGMTALYAAYAVMVGFRYRLLLLLGPIALGWFLNSKSHFVIKLTKLLGATLGMVIFFAFMTLFRTKFGGLDIEKTEKVDSYQALYGLFADTNIVFGWLSAKTSFGTIEPYAGIQPILEVFTQFIPRFIYQDKSLYGHLWTVNYWLGASTESLLSGTAMPFFGEYYVCGGVVALLGGACLYGLLAAKMLRSVIGMAPTALTRVYGVSLFALYIGYYYYSRGSMAQIFKGILFVLGAYALLLVMYRRSHRRILGGHV